MSGEFSFGEFSSNLLNPFGAEQMPVTPSSEGGGGSWWNNFSDFAGQLGSGLSSFGNFAKGLLPIAGLGTGILGAINQFQAGDALADQTKIAEGAAKRSDQISRTAEGAASPLVDFSKTALQRYESGQVSPAITAQVEQWTRAAKQAAMDYAARSGQGSSSQLRQWLAWIDQQAQAMLAAAIEHQAELGIQAGSTAGGILGGAAGAAGQAGHGAAGNVSGIEQLIAAANQAMARLTGGAS